jgi:16S rRNA (guanine527-N7)-methyltransferase
MTTAVFLKNHPWLIATMQQDDFLVAREMLSKPLSNAGLAHALEPCLAYLALLNKWNNAYNLTAIRAVPEMATHHILDSLAILSWIKGERLLDVGSGAGLPGIPLAMACPSLSVVLLDSNGKKTRFLNEVKRVLKLSNIEIVQSRAEIFHPTSGFDTVTSRAFSTIENFIKCTSHLIYDQGVWLAMKGRYPDTELAAIHRPYQVETYRVPGITGDRCCVIVK